MNQQLSVVNLKCEYRTNPIGLDKDAPRFFWQEQSPEQDVLQAAYRIRIFTDPVDSDSVLWDSGEVDSSQSVHVPYGGPKPAPCRRYWYQIKIRDNRGKESPWSEKAYWETGLQKPENWQADWITPDRVVSSTSADTDPCPFLRKTFSLDQITAFARIYASAKGLYQLFLNGERVTEDLFTPGWTVYGKRLQYQTYDITEMLRPGKNALGVILGNGWYKGYLGWEEKNHIFGETLEFLCQLQITDSEGGQETFLSDESWKSSSGPILMSEIYHGEIYDASLYPANWASPDFDDKDWGGTKIADTDKTRLTAQENVPVRPQEETPPVEIIHTPAGETVLDFGQNMVGWIRLKVSGEKGSKVIMEHAEVLDNRGNFYRDNIRKAEQKIEYRLRGGGEETYEPHFTFQGFRYVKLHEFPGTPEKEMFTGIAVHSDMAPTGRFSCSNPLLNQLQHNIQWGQKGNFLDVPTDCPQRDERLGWTGDAQVFARTACFNRDTALFFAKWMEDVKADQRVNGSVPAVVPSLPGVFMANDSGCGWGDAAVIVPWTVYLCYGDKTILARQYETMI